MRGTIISKDKKQILEGGEMYHISTCITSGSGAVRMYLFPYLQRVILILKRHIRIEYKILYNGVFWYENMYGRLDAIKFQFFCKSSSEKVAPKQKNSIQFNLKNNILLFCTILYYIMKNKQRSKNTLV